MSVYLLFNAKLAIIPLIYHSKNKFKNRYKLYTKLKRLVVFLWCQLTETTVHGRHVATLSLCSFSLMLCVYRKKTKYLAYSLWLDLLRTRNHELPQSTITITPPMTFSPYIYCQSNN